MKQPQDLVDRLDDILSEFWIERKVWIWSRGIPFTSFIGSELLDFMLNADKIVAFLRFHFKKSERVTDLCDALTIWAEISPFKNITKIYDIEVYKEKIDSFNQNLDLFYKVG